MRFKFIVIAMITVISLVGSCNRISPPSTTEQEVSAHAWYNLYFTQPGEAGTGLAVESALVDAIASADHRIDLALYSFSLATVADALIAADARDVEIRMVMEADNMDSYQVRRLLAAGIPIRPDDSEGLMHDKFVVIDGQVVWTGSMNLTITGALEDANNLVRIASPNLAVDYTLEFEAMYLDGLFGDQHWPEIPYPLLSVGGTTVEVYFSPNDDTSRRLVELINEAQTSIVFLASNFTSDPLTQAMLSARRRGVTVSGLMDAGNALSDTGSDYLTMVEAGIPILLDKDPGRMHHKVLIIDNAIVVFGSYNFTASAEKRNDENLLIIHDPELAARFFNEYRRLIE
jgi:phosphatidylserine/phosphatidylglycerophosphate/cardiolipin synthase-like enzyme